MDRQRRGVVRRRQEMRLRKAMEYLTVAGCACAIIAGGAFAGEEQALQRISSNLDIAYLSKYVWRGVPLNPGPVVQPSLTFTLPNGFSYNLWMSMNTADNTVAGNADMVVEHDHTVCYPFTFVGREMSVGYIYYAFPNTGLASTQEFFGTVSLGGKFSPSISVNYDSDEVRGAYFTISGAHTLTLPTGRKPGIPVELSAKLGYGTASYIRRAYPGASEKAAPLDLVVGATTAISLGERYSLTPYIAYSTLLDSNVSKTIDEPDNFIAGITLGSSF